MVAKSIKTWTVAFLSVDLLFWLSTGYSCVRDQVSCFETVGFGVYFFYLPFTLLPVVVPPPVWVIVHGLLGALVGWLLRHQPVRWWLAGIISFILLLGVSYGLGQWQMRRELDRETTTQLWVIDQASNSLLKFSTATQMSDGTFKLAEGKITVNLEAYDTTRTQVELLLCDQSDCSHSEVMSYQEYLAAKTVCHKQKTVCPYFNLEKSPTAFEVTSNPKEIITMRQTYLPLSSMPVQ